MLPIYPDPNKTMQTLSPELLASHVTGRNLVGATLADQLAGGACLIVFLRHFG